ncbi:uncharacterized protein GJ701_012118 [Geothlypis trichas]
MEKLSVPHSPLSAEHRNPVITHYKRLCIGEAGIQGKGQREEGAAVPLAYRAPVSLEEAAAPAPGPKRGRQPRPPGLAPSGPGAPPHARPRGPRPAARGCGSTRSLAGRTLTGAGAVRGDQRSAAEAVSAAQREASDLGCERRAPAAEPPLRRTRPPFPASLANAGRARSRLEPSVARRLPQPLAGGSRPSAAKEGKPAGSPRPLQGALRPVHLGGWGRAPPPRRPPGIAPSHGCRLSLSVRLPHSALGARPGSRLRSASPVHQDEPTRLDGSTSTKCLCFSMKNPAFEGVVFLGKTTTSANEHVCHCGACGNLLLALGYGEQGPEPSSP